MKVELVDLDARLLNVVQIGGCIYHKDDGKCPVFPSPPYRRVDGDVWCDAGYQQFRKDMANSAGYIAAAVTPQAEVTVAQWARAEALKALMGSRNRGSASTHDLALQVCAWADLIVTGSLPKPPPGVTW